MGIGQGVQVRENNVKLYQCPGTWCNFGWAHTKQDIALICKLGPWNTGNGWVMVFNRGYHNDYNVVGWVDRSYLIGIRYDPPLCYGSGRALSRGYDMIAYQCPAAFCNPSSVWKAADDVAVFCKFTGGWNMLLNQEVGLKQVGFQTIGISDIETC
jgi:hypothetical protein